MKTFQDNKGIVWRPIISVPTIIEICRDMDITFDLLKQPGKLNIGDLIDMLWYTCKYQAKINNISRETFFENLPIDRINDVVQCLIESAIDAFPQLKDLTGIPQNDPLPSQSTNPQTD